MKRLSNGRFALWICAAFVIPVAAMFAVRSVVTPWLDSYWTDVVSMAPVAVITPLFVWLLGRYIRARDRDTTSKQDGIEDSHV